MLKILVDAPKTMVEYAKTASAKDKPYDICLHCPFISESCDGPNILAMDYPRWVEWARDRMKLRDLTKGEIAMQSGLPLSTVKSAFSGNSYDIRTETMREITRVLIGGCWGQYPCHLAAILMAGTAQDAEPEHLSAGERAQMEEQIRQIKADYQAKVDYLKERIVYLQTQIEHKNTTIDKLMDRLLKEK